MPFGLAVASASFCRLMSIVFKDHLWKICLSYLYDIIVFDTTPEDLLDGLRIALNRLREVDVKIQSSKCALFKRDIEFLGHLVSVNGVDLVADRLKSIRDWPTPHCLGDVPAFFGLASYYRRFVHNFASIAEPLTRLTKKNTSFKWSDDSDLAFCRLKQPLLEATTLDFPIPGLPCILNTDASDVAVGAVLSQLVNVVERPDP